MCTGDVTLWCTPVEVYLLKEWIFFYNKLDASKHWCTSEGSLLAYFKARRTAQDAPIFLYRRNSPICCHETCFTVFCCSGKIVPPFRCSDIMHGQCDHRCYVFVPQYVYSQSQKDHVDYADKWLLRCSKRTKTLRLLWRGKNALNPTASMSGKSNVKRLH